MNSQTVYVLIRCRIQRRLIWVLLIAFFVVVVVVDCRNTRVKFKVDFTVKISNAPLALDKIGQCLKFKQSDQILKH